MAVNVQLTLNANAVVAPALTEKLHFEREFQSLNKTRNCLEHRHGIVGARDVNKDTGTLTLL